MKASCANIALGCIGGRIHRTVDLIPNFGALPPFEEVGAHIRRKCRGKSTALQPVRDGTRRWRMIQGWSYLRSAARPECTPRATRDRELRTRTASKNCLREMQRQMRGEDRRARFVCVIAAGRNRRRSRRVFGVRRRRIAGGTARAKAWFWLRSDFLLSARWERHSAEICRKKKINIATAEKHFERRFLISRVLETSDHARLPQKTWRNVSRGAFDKRTLIPLRTVAQVDFPTH